MIGDFKQKIYIDTSVLSYLSSKPTKEPIARARQILSKKWWGNIEDFSQIFISVYTIEELEKGDKAAAQKRVSLIENLSILDSSTDIEKFAKIIFNELRIPEKSKLDAYHLSIAAIQSMDLVVSWNFKHMANAFIRKFYKSICHSEGIFAPEIVTPEELLEE